jgi:hypothetical protein
VACGMGLDGQCYAQVTYLAVGIFVLRVCLSREAGVVMCANHTVFTPRGAERRKYVSLLGLRCQTPTTVSASPVAGTDDRRGPGRAPADKPPAAFLSTAAKKQRREYLSRWTMSLGLALERGVV